MPNKPVAAKSLPFVRFTPEGETSPLTFTGGLWECGSAVNGLHFEYGDGGGGVIKNSDLMRLRDLINEHLDEVIELAESNSEPTQTHTKSANPAPTTEDKV